ncbi:MAG TPA: hypothetical protein VF530_19630 [Planctomycetota bacterium]
MSPRTSPLALGILLTLTPTTTSQDEGSIPVPPGPLGGQYSSIVAEDLDGNFSPEIAVLRTNPDRALIVFHNPDVTQDAVEVATGALDVCAYPVPDENGRARLLFTTATDVQTVTFVEDHYELGTISFPPSLVGATHLRVGLQGGVHYLFYLAADGKSFHRALAGGGGLSAPQHLGTLVPAVLDFVLLDCDADGLLDLGIMTANGVNVRPQSWEPPLLSRGGVFPGDAIAAVDVIEVGECLAWVTRASPTQAKLLLLHPTLGPAYPMLDLPSAANSSLVAADVDADGLEDLVVGRSESFADVLLQVAAPQYFDDTGEPIDMSAGGPTVSMGRLLCGDLFNDKNGNGNVLPGFAAMLPTLEVLQMLRATEPGPPQLPYPDYQGVTYASAWFPQCQSPNSGPSRWEIWTGTGWGSTGANALELIVRRQDGSLMHANALRHRRFWLVNGEIPASSVYFETILDDYEGSSTKYWAQIRPVLVDLSPDAEHPEYPMVPAEAVTLEVWRWSVLGMAGTCAALAELRLPSSLSPEVPICAREGSCGEWGCSVGWDPAFCDTFLGLPQQDPVTLIPSAVPKSKVPSSPGQLPIIPPFNE